MGRSDRIRLSFQQREKIMGIIRCIIRKLAVRDGSHEIDLGDERMETEPASITPGQRTRNST